MTSTDLYSRAEPGLLLHQVVRPNSLTSPKRVNVSPDNESLQVALIALEKNQTFNPHYHTVHDRNMPKAQESWVVIRGSVKVIYYDVDQKIISEEKLSEGEASITYHGGHNYVALSENALVYEFKTGPYLGVKADKVQING